MQYMRYMDKVEEIQRNSNLTKLKNKYFKMCRSIIIKYGQTCMEIQLHPRVPDYLS